MNLVTIAQAAKELGITRQAVEYIIKRGGIKQQRRTITETIERKRRIAMVDLEEIKAARER